jgi:hypothetical protein
MSLIPQWIDEIKGKLYDEQGGYRVGEAADVLFRRAEKGCVLTNEMRDLGRKGANVAVREHNTASTGRAPRGMARQLARVIAGAEDDQRDFHDIAGDFNWMDGEASLDDTVDAIRKAYRHMTLHEARLVVTLKTKKATETFAAATQIQDFIDSHPEWEQDPERTLGEIAGID